MMEWGKRGREMDEKLVGRYYTGIRISLKTGGENRK